MQRYTGDQRAGGINTIAGICLHGLAEGASNFPAAGSIPSTDPALIQLGIGSDLLVTACLDALALHADGGGVGATCGAIDNLCQQTDM